MLIYQKKTLKLAEKGFGERTLSGVIFNLNTEIFQIENYYMHFITIFSAGEGVHTPNFPERETFPQLCKGGRPPFSPLAATGC